MKNNYFYFLIFIISLNIVNISNTNDEIYYSELEDSQLCATMDTIWAHTNLIGKEALESRAKRKHNILLRSKCTTDFCWNTYTTYEKEYEHNEKTYQETLEKYYGHLKLLNIEINKRLHDDKKSEKEKRQLEKMRQSMHLSL